MPGCFQIPATVASWYGRGGNQPLTGGDQRDYAAMFDDDLATYWLGYLDENGTPLEHNCVVVTFDQPVKFDELQIVTRPGGKQYFGETYQNLCLYLDDTLSQCTPS